MSAEGVGVVVLSFGPGGEAEGSLTSLIAEGVSPESIVVVHNPSAPGELGPPLPAGCEPLRPPYNLGYAAGMNMGIERQLARGVEFVLLLTHDARLRSGALAALLAAARERPDFGVLGPALVVGDGHEPFSFGGMTRPNGSVTHVRERPAASAGAVVGRDWIDGGTMLIRGEMLARIGGFDERFWGYGEDADLCLRATRAGYGVGVVVAAVAEQTPGGTKRLGAWSYLITRNGLEYARRAVGMRAAMGLGGRIVWLAGVGFARTAARRARLRSGDPATPWTQSIAVLRGIADFVLRRWGPPPRLRGMGDVRNARRPAVSSSAQPDNATSARRVHLFGCPLDPVTMGAAVARCDHAIETGAYLQHMSMNVAKLVALQEDPRLLEIVSDCGLVTADGQGVVWASRLLGSTLPERVAGIDLMQELLGMAERKEYRVYVLGARQAVLDTALERIRRRFPDLSVVGAHHGYFDDSEAPRICDEIRATSPDILFVAMSSPRKEYFLGENGPRLGVAVTMGVGGSLDVIAGVTKRSPVLLQRIGLEWAYRLVQEPRRLAARYAFTNLRFARMVIKSLVSKRANAAASATGSE